MGKSIKAKKAILKFLKIIWIPLLLFIAIASGLYIGYEFITGTSGINVFNMETWRDFFDQIRSLR